ncbi:hypothetical protein EG328_007985 [Venturia inaequalis]|uniref:Uncharacterized protein n=1 Tax=Venturia inaequalis TaxID=5025 RepID=A0A8H3VAA8_VENIN|nr:hypothetical protein EG328_007985 [Venturia inaequalis]
MVLESAATAQWRPNKDEGQRGESGLMFGKSNGSLRGNGAPGTARPAKRGPNESALVAGAQRRVVRDRSGRAARELGGEQLELECSSSMVMELRERGTEARGTEAQREQMDGLEKSLAGQGWGFKDNWVAAGSDWHVRWVSSRKARARGPIRSK